MKSLPSLYERTKPFFDNIDRILKESRKPNKRQSDADRQRLLFELADNALDLGAVIRTEVYRQNSKLREAAIRKGREIPNLPFGRKRRARV
jgi:hypothetical protein